MLCGPGCAAPLWSLLRVEGHSQGEREAAWKVLRALRRREPGCRPSQNAGRPPAPEPGCFGAQGQTLGAGAWAETPFLRQPCPSPAPRILEVPYAYQCCAYGVCASFFKASGQWGADIFHLEDEETPKGPLGLLAGQAESHCECVAGAAEVSRAHRTQRVEASVGQAIGVSKSPHTICPCPSPGG